MNLQTGFKKFYYTVKTSFWFIPVLMVLTSVLTSILCVWIDRSLILVDITWFKHLYHLDQETLRSLVNTIAGSMITVTSIAFSITIVTLTLASSQFGPRLIRNFMDDTGTQVVLGTFIANFSFCLVLVYVMSMQAHQNLALGFSIAWCLAATFMSVFVLIYFIHHVARSIQADNVVDQVYCEVLKALQHLSDELDSPKCSDSKKADNTLLTMTITAGKNGYLQVLNKASLLKLACEHDLTIRFSSRPGDMLAKDIKVAEVDANYPVSEKVIEKIRALFIVGSKRTPIQDPEYAIHQLVEIAVRALSPGVNDPYTAISCVDKLSVALCELANAKVHSGRYYDQQKNLRLQCKAHDFNGLASAAFDQIRQYAETSIAVTIRLVESLQRLVSISQRQDVHQFAKSQLQAILQKSNDHAFAEQDMQDINAIVNQVRKTLISHSD
ncbi:DUF2254 domain-containing protein [Aliiglaciecola litoralis]|uniref:DUF2254 domain-containing protein n=1 Tax=Aliiglaciecola litoralis TaxID=582857 RepID=A0ABP3WPL7_9ALTE